MRYLAVVLVSLVLTAAGIAAFGRALDVEGVEHVIFTRAGVTLDCERHNYHAGDVISYEDGSTAIAREGDTEYENCHRVP